MKLLSYGPEPYASANSAISASTFILYNNLRKSQAFFENFFIFFSQCPIHQSAAPAHSMKYQGKERNVNMQEVSYNRTAAVSYAKEWALGRNPAYYDFGGIGGDCTGFISQSIFAGSGVMNYTPTFGWYYISANDRSPSWTGVQYLYNFLTQNDGVGPYGAEVPRGSAQLGDVVQLGRHSGEFYHSLMICGFRQGRILICAHSDDALMRPLSSYRAERLRFIHIQGVRAD